MTQKTKTGALIFDETADRYDIRFDLADYYGGLLRNFLPLSLLHGKFDFAKVGQKKNAAICDASNNSI